jgi:hypothetical protein
VYEGVRAYGLNTTAIVAKAVLALLTKIQGGRDKKRQ